MKVLINHPRRKTIGKLIDNARQAGKNIDAATAQQLFDQTVADLNSIEEKSETFTARIKARAAR